MSELLGAEQEGEKAAKSHRHFRDACPYLYSRFPGMTQAQFNTEKRPLMDAWFRGWKRWLDANDIGYTLLPKGMGRETDTLAEAHNPVVSGARSASSAKARA